MKKCLTCTSKRDNSWEDEIFCYECSHLYEVMQVFSNIQIETIFNIVKKERE